MFRGNDAAAGYVGGAVTDAILYVVDSYKTQSQAKGPIQLSRLARGLGPLSLMGSGPSFAVFFGIYAPMHEMLGGGPEAVAAASLVASLPATMVGVPSDTLKKQVVVGHYPSVRAAASAIVRTRGVQGLFVGWQANLLRDIPTAVLKMSLYEGMVTMYKLAMGSNNTDNSLSPLEHGLVGFSSGGIAAFLTNPLDVVNTRIKVAANVGGGMLHTAKQVVKADGVSALFAGLPSRILMFGVGSSIFWTVHAKAKTSFSAYENLPIS